MIQEKGQTLKHLLDGLLENPLPPRPPPLQEPGQVRQHRERIHQIHPRLLLGQEQLDRLEELGDIRVVKQRPPTKDHAHDHRVRVAPVGREPPVRLMEVVPAKLPGLEILEGLEHGLVRDAEDLVHDPSDQAPSLPIRHQHDPAPARDNVLGHGKGRREL